MSLYGGGEMKSHNVSDAELPLAGINVLDFSQFLAGPSATLRLADMGANVIKVERPDGGDLCRNLHITDTDKEGDSTLFHAINRNKRSFAADLKSDADLAVIKKLIAKADIMVENFRPGIMNRLGLGYDAVKEINPKIIYGSVTGYGPEGPWTGFPGQDLLAQSLSGLVWLSGNADQGPVPMGLAIADLITGAHLAQGLLAALTKRFIQDKGSLVEVNLLASTLDLQFEVLTTYLNDGGRPPRRAAVNNAHAWLGAPYGLYETQNGWMAVAMGALETLASALDCPQLREFDTKTEVFTKRDEVKAVLAAHLKNETTDYWLERLRKVDYWCAPVLHWHELLEHDGFKSLEMLQTLTSSSQRTITTTRCPISFDGKRPTSPAAAPDIGNDNDWVLSTILTED